MFAVLQTYLGGYYVNDFNLYGKVWKVMVQAEGSRRISKDDIERLYVLNRQRTASSPRLTGRCGMPWARSMFRITTCTTPQRSPASPPRGIARARRSPRWNASPTRFCPKASRTNGRARRFRSKRPATWRTYIFALSIVCVFLFMAALYESWIRPLVIILTVPLAMFGAMIGLWIYDMPLDVFGQIGLVMLIGLETKNAILVVEFGVELSRSTA